MCVQTHTGRGVDTHAHTQKKLQEKIRNMKEKCIFIRKQRIPQ